jgi:hypothetical protein
MQCPPISDPLSGNACDHPICSCPPLKPGPIRPQLLLAPYFDFIIRDEFVEDV